MRKGKWFHPQFNNPLIKKVKMEKENMKIVNLSTEITRRYTVSVLVHKDMEDNLFDEETLCEWVHPHDLEEELNGGFGRGEPIDENGVQIEPSYKEDSSEINLVLTENGMRDFDQVESEDLVWEIT